MALNEQLAVLGTPGTWYYLWDFTQRARGTVADTTLQT